MISKDYHTMNNVEFNKKENKNEQKLQRNDKNQNDKKKLKLINELRDLEHKGNNFNEDVDYVPSFGLFD
jgi:hypothetical protein